MMAYEFFRVWSNSTYCGSSMLHQKIGDQLLVRQNMYMKTNVLCKSKS